MREKLDVDLDSLARELELYENPPTEKQRDILRAAEELFAQQGFSDTPTAEIARKAGVTEKTLFKHFPTKVHLLRRVLFPALLKTLLPAQFRKVKRIINASHASYPEAIAEIARDRLEGVRQHGARIRLVLLELSQNDSLREKFIKLWADHVWGDLEALVIRHRDKGEIRSDIEIRAIARAQFYMIAGYVVTSSLFKGSRAPDDFELDLQQLLKILWEGVRNQPVLRG